MTANCEKRAEKYRPWEKHAQCITLDSTKRVEPISLCKVHDSVSTSDSGAWIPVSGDVEFAHNIFNDPGSDKENTPMANTQTTLTLNDLNITEDELPPPQTSPDYIMMVASPQQANQPVKEVRGILLEKMKMPCRWPKCLKRSSPKIVLMNNDIYSVQKAQDHYYEEPQEPQEKGQ